MKSAERLPAILLWFVIQCGDSELTVLKWNSETANAAGARHLSGKPPLRCTSADGLSQCVRHRNRLHKALVSELSLRDARGLESRKQINAAGLSKDVLLFLIVLGSLGGGVLGTRRRFRWIVVQIGPEPSLHFRHAHPLARGIVGNLIAIDLAQLK